MDRAKKIRYSSGISATVLFALISMLVVITTVLLLNLSKLIIILYFIMSLITIFAYKFDKSAAEKGKWRTPESTLNLLALCCGWPGALIAQHIFRHKTQKQPFKTILWVAIILNIGAYSWFIYSFAA